MVLVAGPHKNYLYFLKKTFFHQQVHASANSVGLELAVVLLEPPRRLKQTRVAQMDFITHATVATRVICSLHESTLCMFTVPLQIHQDVGASNKRE